MWTQCEPCVTLDGSQSKKNVEHIFVVYYIRKCASNSRRVWWRNPKGFSPDLPRRPDNIIISLLASVNNSHFPGEQRRPRARVHISLPTIPPLSSLSFHTHNLDCTSSGRGIRNSFHQYVAIMTVAKKMSIGFPIKKAKKLVCSSCVGSCIFVESEVGIGSVGRWGLMEAL